MPQSSSLTPPAYRSGYTVHQIPDGAASTSITGTHLRVQSGSGPDSITSGAAGFNDYVFGAATINLTANGDGNHIFGGSGVENIAVWDHTAGGSTWLSVGDGNDKLAVLSDNASIVGGNGNDTVNSNGANAIIQLGGGNDAVFSNGAAAQVSVGGGNDGVHLGGNGDAVVLGGGTDTVWSSGSNTTISGGAGLTHMQLSGAGDTVTFGNGTNVLVDTGGSATISAGTGHNIIVLVSDNNVVTTAATQMMGCICVMGNHNDVTLAPQHTLVQLNMAMDNTFHFQAPAAGSDISVKDFNPSNGNIFDLTGVMNSTNWNGDLSTLGNYLSVQDIGADTRLMLDQSGQAGGAKSAVMMLTGYTANNLDQLMSTHDFTSGGQTL